MSVTILAIESSCDDTSAAIIRDGYALSNLIANQDIHKEYGGVVPELASRAHQVNIVPVTHQAMVKAGVKAEDIDAVAFTRGPGLLGSLLVGTSFAKGFALVRNLPLIEVNHLQAHVMSHFILEKDKENRIPVFPFLCLLVSGGHTRIIVMNSHLDMEVIGNTIDDAAGEAFDKCGKIMGFQYPAGPAIDKLARQGNKHAFSFTKPSVKGLDFSFSGLKTNFLYFLRDRVNDDPDFITNNRTDLCASLQHVIISILVGKLVKASIQTGIKEIGIAGGVSANSGLRDAVSAEAEKRKWNIFLPEFRYTTDNAAMIGIAGYYKYLRGEFSSQDVAPLARL
ncbi:MAG TPA: tRNA (adenosine(37)-N6)-threonylcarbamoyltransferase complex transferase subunit TsaD [Bacteroidales bacterium]|nr:tRNA (adenosine(37)-N6)-threonylcarbamoyltransferase complex transferase subunit TsaD [Bacteroidales bacterium]HPT20826.1 tRNA (adenosine(37)-N6)-threonylcarbamoyltransferase complex transferase subunit TsaD [Bacteroidales bacterium]